ncbi:hypothetical protein SESBI_07930 [Sesbania bispinosa]|nr:hypothetical protein SESBI_07930 [Sesbania bispinosa]
MAHQQQNDVVEDPDSSNLVQFFIRAPHNSCLRSTLQLPGAELVSVSLMDLLEETEADLDRNEGSSFGSSNQGSASMRKVGR